MRTPAAANPAKPWIPTRDLDDILAQHQCLHALVAQFLRADQAPQRGPALIALLDTAMALMDRHFRNEERVLRSMGHPSLAEQRAAHCSILTGMYDLQLRVHNAVPVPPVEIHHALDEFLMHDVLDDQVFPPPRRIAGSGRRQEGRGAAAQNANAAPGQIGIAAQVL